MPDETKITDADVSVNPAPAPAIVPEVDHPFLTVGEVTLLHGAGFGDLLTLISTLLKSNAIQQAMDLIRLFSDRNTTLGALIDAIQKAVQTVFGQNLPTPPKKLQYSPEDKRPTREDVLAELQKQGLNTSFLPIPVLGLLIQLAIQFGMPFIQGLIDKYLHRQSEGHQF